MTASLGLLPKVIPDASSNIYIENTVRYLGVDVDDALTLSDRTEI